MKTVTAILALAMGLGMTFAAPAPAPAPYPYKRDDNTWTATDYSEGCGEAGCVYGFTLTKAASNNSQFPEPAFSTFCNGTNIQNRMNPCENPQITTNAVPGTSNETIVVQHNWIANLTGGGEAEFWIVGNVTIVGFPFPSTFEVPQMEEFAVA